MRKRALLFLVALAAIFTLPAAVTKINLATQVVNTLPCGNLPALTGDVTTTVNTCATAIAASTVTRADIATSAVTVLGTTGTVNVDMALGEVYTMTPTGTVTLTASNCVSGRRSTIIVTTSGTTSFTITPSTNMKGTALSTGTTTAKTFGWSFICNSTTAVQQGAATAAI